MKFKFGFYNGCYWLIISTAEQLVFAIENMRMTNTEIGIYLEALNNFKVIYLNEMGGYHTGKVQTVEEDKTQIIVRDLPIFPSKLDRVEVMKVELLNEINSIEEELGLPLTKKLIL